MKSLDSRFVKRSKKCASRLMTSDDLLLISHIDADGLTSAGIASTALDRAGIEHDTWFSKQLDEEDLKRIVDQGYDTVLFTDFGSGLLDTINDYDDFTPVVADHHQPEGDCEYHLNPLLFDIDGSSEISGAGTTYVLARSLGGEKNKDLASLAVVGAVGDMQDSREGRLTGANEVIVQEGVEAGVLEPKRDILLFGRQTRPLPKLLEYSTDVFIPGISNNEQGAVSFLKDLGIPLKNGETWRRWVDLTDGEKQTIISHLFQRCIERGIPAEEIESLVGESYTLTQEEEGTELRDATEFSTLLNSTARYRRAEVGFAVCKGDRGEALNEARKLLRNHRRNIRQGIDFVGNNGVTSLENIQYFDAGDKILDTIVGIIAGMSYSLDGVSRTKPIIAFANSEENKLDVEEAKVSSRGTQSLVRKGLNLAEVMAECSKAVGGEGGGHNIAAGATIPRSKISQFVKEADEMVGEQIS
ncbi:MAG: DHH family phosphoesterase [Halobacteria archaeon]|nr:DHH family phosphoesterase [Halobacteria archaeon]